MILKTLGKLARFRRTEDGIATVEFVIIFPVYMFFILSTVEYSLVTMQQAMLDHSMDRTVREIRLGTGTAPTHDEIKESICAKSGMIRDCSDSLQLEMIIQNPRAGVTLPAVADCTDTSEEVKPVREFSNGGANALMILRACAMVDPVFPTSSFGRALADDTGKIKLTVTTAFVQEP